MENPGASAYDAAMNDITRHFQTNDNGELYGDRVERFCGTFVESRNKGQAYRVSFVVDKAATAAYILKRADQLLADPWVRARIQELRDHAAQEVLVTTRELLQDWHDIATADPNELISYVRTNCRFCRGIGHHYQWGTDLEYAQACEEAIKIKQPLPDCSGGFDFDGTLDPVPSCPSCFGQGQGSTFVHDTRKLSPKARKLYMGVKETRNGIEVLMHDQQKARESIARVFGAFKDGMPYTPAAPGADEKKPVTAQEAQKSYLRLIQGGKAG